MAKIFENVMMKGAVFGGIARVSSVLFNLLLTPLLFNAMQIELFGLWMLFSTIIAALSFSDLGLGNGLVNELINESESSTSKQKTYISSTFYCLLSAGTLILLISILTTYFFDLKNIFNVGSDVSDREFYYGLLFFIFSLSVTMPLSIVQKIQTARHRIDRLNQWIIAAQLTNFIATAGVAILHPNFLLLVAVYVLTPVIILALSYFREYQTFGQSILPSPNYFDGRIALNMLRNGSFFLCLQILSIIGAYSDQVYIALFLGPQDVAVFSIYQKIATTILVVQFVVLPLWPAAGDAILQERYYWLLSILKKLLLFLTIVTLAIALVYYFYAYGMISFWLGPSNTISYNLPLILAFSCWMMVASIGGAVSTVMNNKIFIKYQVVFYCVATIVSVVLKSLTIPEYGLHAAVYSTTFAYGVFFIIPSLIWVFLRLARLEQQRVDATEVAG